MPRYNGSVEAEKQFSGFFYFMGVASGSSLLLNSLAVWLSGGDFGVWWLAYIVAAIILGCVIGLRKLRRFEQANPKQQRRHNIMAGIYAIVAIVAFGCASLAVT